MARAGWMAATIAAASCYQRVDVPAPTTPTFVQQNTGNMSPTGSLSVSFTSTPEAGDFLVMVGAAADASLKNVSGVATSWTKATGALQGKDIEVWYSVADSSDTTVTIEAEPSSPGPMWMSVTEWSGLAAPNLSVDAQPAIDSTPGSVTTATTAPVTSTGTDLVIFGVSALTVCNSPGSDWMTLNPVNLTGSTGSPIVQDEWYMLTDGSASISASVLADNWDAALVAFRPAP